MFPQQLAIDPMFQSHLSLFCAPLEKWSVQPIFAMPTERESVTVTIEPESESTTATRDMQFAADAVTSSAVAPAVPGLKLAAATSSSTTSDICKLSLGSLSGLGGRVLGALTPRSSGTTSPRSTPRTPREPEEKILNVCLVLDSNFTHLSEERPAYERKQFDPTGIVMQGAMVDELKGLLVASFAGHYDWALQKDDVILKFGDERFESERFLSSYIPAVLTRNERGELKKRCYTLQVRRLVMPPSWPLTARLSKALSANPPEDEDQMEDVLFEHETLNDYYLNSTMGPMSGVGNAGFGSFGMRRHMHYDGGLSGGMPGLGGGMSGLHGLHR